ncbi:MAG: substrate-binding domain-containing protein [Ilumatobacteraceae bacterium]|nr:MAG: substrate-binding domain-containing protein [Actinomycetota bacterium]
MNISPSRIRLVGVAMVLGLVASACGGDDTTTDDSTTDDSTPATGSPDDSSPAGELPGGSVFVTGSSTVERISIRVGELALEESDGALKATVEGPGTGDGFAKFCAGEADISDASRQIKEEEAATCADNGVEFVELEVAIDGLTVATSTNNTEVECLDIPGLYALLGPESEGMGNWSDANDLAGEVGSASAPFPDAPLVVHGPGEESGTYDTFVEFAIADLAEERGQFVGTRPDYASSANDNLIVDGIEESDTSLGWVGYAFYQSEQERMKSIAIDGGEGCVTPTTETIADGSYPFSRSLYVYVNSAKAAENPAVAAFVDLYLSEAGLAQVALAGYVDLPADRLQATAEAWANR